MAVKKENLEQTTRISSWKYADRLDFWYSFELLGLVSIQRNDVADWNVHAVSYPLIIHPTF
jgi:hypothetical protein